MKKILIIATAILVFILLLIFVLNSFKKSPQINPNIPSVTPTTVPVVFDQNSQLLDVALSAAPFESDDFRYEYSPQLNKMVVTAKSDEGAQKFTEWMAQNGLQELAGNPEIIVYQEEGLSTGGTYEITEPVAVPTGTEYDKTIKPLIDFLNVFINFGQGIQDESATPTPIQIPTATPNQEQPQSTINNQDLKYTYYAQCNGYGDIPLPSGCNLCEAGCGPTTVAMIASSYLGNQYNPKILVDIYDESGYYLSCAGSRYSDAKAALEKLGLKTTSYMTYNFEKAEEVVEDFKKYLDSGWTIFTLANYCDQGCGHYFWVTEVKDGNILAYDPYYGKSSTPPINENSRYPFPKYRVAFGVKK